MPTRARGHRTPWRIGTPHAGRPRYDRLVDDGVIEWTIAIGFDEGADRSGGDPGGARVRVAALVDALRARRYVEGFDAAVPLLSRRGRVAGECPCSTFLSSRNAFLNPSSGDRSAHVVVRIVANTTGRLGPEAARACVDGLAHSSICVYAGHARYGLGPDFEPAVAMTDEQWNGPGDRDRLLRVISREAESKGVALERVLDAWAACGRLIVRRSAQSRVIVEDRPATGRSARARLMQWCADPDPDARSPVAFGPNGLLACADSTRYRLWFLLACYSADWLPAIRSTPGLDDAAIAIVGCPDRVGAADLLRFPWALDALSAGASWTDVLRALAGSPLDPAARFLVDDGDAEHPRSPSRPRP